jgi:hypothetical protein
MVSTTKKDNQYLLLKGMMGTVHHFFGSWEKIFGGVSEARDQSLIIYPIAELLFTGVLMYLFRLGARRQINYELRKNEASEGKFKALWGKEKVPHGDTLNYGFKKLDVGEVQEVICHLVETLIRKRVLARWRFFGTYLIATDGTGEVSYEEQHCEHCLTRKLPNGKTLYYHPVVEAKVVTSNGFAFSIMTEFVENPADFAKGDKQDCETKAFRRLAKKLKERFPRLPITILLDGLFADGPTLQICKDNRWKYLIVLKDDDLKNLHRSFEVVWGADKKNCKQIMLGKHAEIHQEYRWANKIAYCDTKENLHHPNIIECTETKSGQKKKHLWITNHRISFNKVDVLANTGGRLRWKIENEGFNVQKNGGYHLEHAYSHHPNAKKVFYLLLQLAHLLFQLIEKGSLFRKAFPTGVGSQKNLAARLLEAWRNLPISPAAFCRLYGGRSQIRFDTS